MIVESENHPVGAAAGITSAYNAPIAGAFQSSTAHSSRPRFSRLHLCARLASSPLPMPWLRSAGVTNRSSSQMPCRPTNVENV